MNPSFKPVVKPLHMAFALTLVALAGPWLSAQMVPTSAVVVSQVPLMTQTSTQPTPNITYMIDDSSGMTVLCVISPLYAAAIQKREKRDPSPSECGSITPNDVQSLGLEGDAADAANGTSAVHQLKNPNTISPFNNLLAYNPDVRYDRGYMVKNGQIVSNPAPILKPNDSNGWGSVTFNNDEFLTSFPRATEAKGELWYKSQMGTVEVEIDGVSTVAKRVYLPKNNIKGLTAATASTKYDLDNPANYEALYISFKGFAKVDGKAAVPKTGYSQYSPINASADRTDCVADVRPNVARQCTALEEMKNLANWYMYHRTRLLSARTGTQLAFLDQKPEFRFNYRDLFNWPLDPSSSSGALLKNVRVFDNTQKMAFFNWLNGLSGSASEIKISASLEDVGMSYQDATNKGPWAHTPWTPGKEASTAHLSCRRSFVLLATDGNETAPSTTVGDWDSKTASKINYGSCTGSACDGYTYTPAARDPMALGKSDYASTGTAVRNTFADMAMKYWVQDLRPNLPNDAQPLKSGKPFWQNLTTYTLSFVQTGFYTRAQLDAARKGTLNWPNPNIGTVNPKYIDDLAHGAHNSGGKFTVVSNAKVFAEELKKMLLDIAAQTLSQAGVAASTTALQTDSLKLVPYYTSTDWWGNVRAFTLNSSNASVVDAKWSVISTDDSGRPNAGESKSDGTKYADTIPAHGSRNIWVYAGSDTNKAIEFKTPLAMSSNGLIGTGPGQMPNPDLSQELNDYIRGDRSKEGPLDDPSKPYRERKAVLGDIVNSKPVFIKNILETGYASLPATLEGASTYKDYLRDVKAPREGVFFVGANDGMLHAFRESNGAEIFAYIPRAVLPHLPLLANKDYFRNHRYYVDGPLSEADAYINAPSSNSSSSGLRWTNLLLGTTGAGAKAVFALDVTWMLKRPSGQLIDNGTSNMAGKNILWEVSANDAGFTDMGHVLSAVQTGVTLGAPASNPAVDGKWVAVFGNGMGSAGGKASLFVVDLATGTLIKQLATDNATNNGLGGVRLVYNANAQVIGAYAGDLQGRMWRFDLTGDPATWGNGQKVFTAKNADGVAQPITATPEVVPRKGGAGFMVVFGTGKMFEDSDILNTATMPTQSMYSVWDDVAFGKNATAVEVLRSALTQAQASYDLTDKNGDKLYKVQAPVNATTTTAKGCYLDYKYTHSDPTKPDLSFPKGLRTVYPVERLASLVRVDTISAPIVTQNSCSTNANLPAVNFLIDPQTCSCKSSPTMDTNGDGKITSADSTACAYSTQADGTDVAIKMPPSSEKCLTGDCYTVLGSGDSGRLVDAGQYVLVGCNPATDAYQCSRRSVRQIFLRR